MGDGVDVDEIGKGLSDVEVFEIRRDVDSVGHSLMIEHDMSTEAIKVDD